jgi:amino acid adenylation domain-containing protein
MDNYSDSAELSLEQKRALAARLLQERIKETKSVSPLSYGQRALWFLYQLAPDSAAFNINFTARISSELDVPALRRASQTLLDRHPSLRTTFEIRNSGPVQRVHENAAVDFRETNASQWSSAQVKEYLADEAHRPFVLEKGPLVRFELLTRSAQDQILALTVHHIVGDYWSLMLLIRELGLLYPAERDGTRVSLPLPARTYNDYVSWQKKMLEGPEGRRLWEYWQQQLNGELPVLDLPVDRPRQPRQTHAGQIHAFTLDESLTQQLNTLAKNTGATLYIILLAAYQTLLHRYTQQAEILTGSPMFARSRPEFESIVGYFANMVVVRATFSHNPSFRKLVEQGRQAVWGALKHQDYPFSLLVERLMAAQDFSHPPLFQAAFVLEKSQVREQPGMLQFMGGHSNVRLDAAGLDIGNMTIDRRAAQVELTLMMEQSEKCLSGLFEYNSSLFDASTISRLTNHFQTLLRAIINDPDRLVSDFPLQTPIEQQQLLAKFDVVATADTKDECVHRMIEAQVSRYPDSVALAFQERELTYHQLNLRANRLAQHLEALGVGTNVPVIVHLVPSIETIVALLAVLKAGGAFVPVAAGCRSDQLLAVQKDCGASVLLTHQELADGFGEELEVVLLDVERGDCPEGACGNPACDANPASLASIIYSSQARGNSPGVVTTHRSVSNLLRWMQAEYQLTAGDRLLAEGSFGFGRSVWVLLLPLISGACLILSRSVENGEDAAASVKTIARQRCTSLFTTPSMLNTLLAEPGLEECHSLKRVISNGEPLSYVIQERFFARLGADLHNQYGLAEISLAAVSWKCERENTGETVPIGRPRTDMWAFVLDKYLQPVPPGVAGELYVGGIGLSEGYWHRPDLTAEKFIADPFSNKLGQKLYRTGDRVRYTSDGITEFIGRLEDQVEIRGWRIEPAVVEAALNTHPFIQRSLVVARATSTEPQLTAYIVADANHPLTDREVFSYLKKKLPVYMCPTACVMLAAFPLTASGTVDRQSLPPPEEAVEQKGPYIAPRDALEVKLAEIWEDILNVSPVSVRDSFFALGGHSLLAMSLLIRIQEQFNRELPLSVLFNGGTIEDIGAALREQPLQRYPSPLVPIKPGGTKTPLFFVHPMGGNVVAYLQLARLLGAEQPFYALQAVGLYGEEQRLLRIESMAARYLDELRAVQPVGPYLLGGWSFGGVVAFEMAQQLVFQEQEVALIALLDAWAPKASSHAVSDNDSPTALLEHFLLDLGTPFAGELRAAYETLKGLDPDLQVNYALELARQFHLVPPSISLAQINHQLEVLRGNLQALNDYVPRLYPNRLSVFRASEADANGDVDATLGWSNLSAHPVELYDVPGNHYSVLAKPHVETLAEKMRDCIRASLI